MAGLEDDCVVERKDLADLVHSLTTNRSVFVKRLRLMSHYPHKLLVITAALSEVKSPYAWAGGNPNRITQSLIAVLAGLGSSPLNAKASLSSALAISLRASVESPPFFQCFATKAPAN